MADICTSAPFSACSTYLQATSNTPVVGTRLTAAKPTASEGVYSTVWRLTASLSCRCTGIFAIDHPLRIYNHTSYKRTDLISVFHSGLSTFQSSVTGNPLRCRKMNFVNISVRLDGARNMKISPSIRFLCNAGEDGVATGTKSRHSYLFSATLPSHGIVLPTSKYNF